MSTQLDIQSAISESKQTETARQLGEVTRKLEDAMKMVEKMRGERDALQAEVAQLKSGKLNDLHFSAAFQKEFERRGEFQAKYHHALDRCTVSSRTIYCFQPQTPLHMPLFT